TVKVDLNGKTVTPGIINTHVHLEWIGSYGTELGAMKSRAFPLNVRGLKTKDEVLDQIRQVISAFEIPEGQWIYFTPNWTANQAPIIFNELKAAELDKAAPKNPILIRPGMTIENIALANGVAIREMFRK